MDGLNAHQPTLGGKYCVLGHYLIRTSIYIDIKYKNIKYILTMSQLKPRALLIINSLKYLLILKTVPLPQSLSLEKNLKKIFIVKSLDVEYETP